MRLLKLNTDEFSQQKKGLTEKFQTYKNITKT